MPENLSLVALTPADVPAQQAQLVAWCQAKVTALELERDELTENAALAKAHKWKHSSLERAASRVKHRITYYEKIGDAAQAGFLVVPNFDVEVMAVRVDRDAPRRLDSTSRAVAAHAKADLLPSGEGVYVAGQALISSHENRLQDAKDGTAHYETQYYPFAFDEVEFPVIGVKPVILDATARAMALNIFDRIGVVTGRKEDPIVVGQIIDPRQRGSHWNRPKVVSFFIAWWLNTDAL